MGFCNIVHRTHTHQLVAAALAVLALSAPARAQTVSGTSSGFGVPAVKGTATNAGIGAYGKSDSGFGVEGDSTSNAGVYGFSTDDYGVRGESINSSGVYGASTDTAIEGNGLGSGTGVYGVSSQGYGVYATTDSTNVLIAAIRGDNHHAGIGVAGASTDGIGTYGSSSSSCGVWAHSVSGNAICAASDQTDSIVGTAGTNSGSAGVWGKANGSSTWGLYSTGAAKVNGNLTVTGTAAKPGGGVWANTSDARVKKDVHDFKLGLREIENLRPVEYKYNGLGGTEADGKQYVGVIAQELEQVMPFMVSTRKAKLRESDKAESNIKQVDASALTFVLVNAVKELATQNAELARKNAELAARVESALELACKDHPTAPECPNAVASRTTTPPDR